MGADLKSVTPPGGLSPLRHGLGTPRSGDEFAGQLRPYMADVTRPQMSCRPGALTGAPRETIAAIVIVFGALCMVVGVVLPWGTNSQGFVVSGLTGDLGIYTLAIVIAATLSISLAVMAFRGEAVKASSRALGVLATLFCGFLCLLLPAGIGIAAGYQQGSPTRSWGDGEYRSGREVDRGWRSRDRGWRDAVLRT